MSRVKFNVNSEYAYLENFKILSSKAFGGAPLLSKRDNDMRTADTVNSQMHSAATESIILCP